MSNCKLSSKLAISVLTDLLPETNRCLSGISPFLKTTGAWEARTRFSLEKATTSAFRAFLQNSHHFLTYTKE